MQFYSDKTTAWNYLFNIGDGAVFILAGALPLIHGAKIKITGTPKTGIVVGALSLILYGVGLMVWAFYNFYYTNAIPFPSLADVFFIIYYPFVFWAIFIYLRMFLLTIKTSIYVESVVALTLLSLFVFSFLDLSYLADSSMLQTALTVFYPFASAFAISTALIIARVSGGRMSLASTFLFAGLVSRGMADFFFSFRTINGTYWNGDFSDILFALSAYLMGMAWLVIISQLIPQKPETN
ncbi:MAG TPA: hypothetical protein P5056_00795 [Candidatus Paceibacterota bacterium]|nr:hypothetical protein [Candidatus Paceibacterota bacterium]